MKRDRPETAMEEETDHSNTHALWAHGTGRYAYLHWPWVNHPQCMQTCQMESEPLGQRSLEQSKSPFVAMGEVDEVIHHTFRLVTYSTCYIDG